MPIEIQAEDFFENIKEAFYQATESAGGSIDRYFEIDGFTVRLSFAGPALMRHITAALEHLMVDPVSEPSLTIGLWDSQSTKTQIPPPPWSRSDYGLFGEITGYNTDRIKTVFQLGSNILNIVDAEQNLAQFWIRDARQFPHYESAAPLRIILNRWIQGLGCQIIHAAAVGTPEACFLIVGRGMSGKSTTALSCLNSELLYLGDDYVLLSNNPSPTVFSLYNSAKIDRRQIPKMPSLSELMRGSPEGKTEKALFFLHRHYPEKLIKKSRLRGILVPRITGRMETVLKKASPAASLLALAPSTMFQLSGTAGSRIFQSMSELVKDVPCYALELGTDLEKIPCAILKLLS